MQNRLTCWQTLINYLNDWYFEYSDAYIAKNTVYHHMLNNGFRKRRTITTYLSLLKTSEYITSSERFIKVLKEIESDLSIHDARNPLMWPTRILGTTNGEWGLIQGTTDTYSYQGKIKIGYDNSEKIPEFIKENEMKI